MKEILKNHGIYHYGSVSFQHINTFNTRSLSKIPENKKSVLVIIFPYYSKIAFSGNISGYCSVPDYHIVVSQQLKSIISCLEKKYPNEAFVPFVDASPIDEVDAAVKAGLGVRGQNSLLITQDFGSFVFIGEIVTSLALDDALHAEKSCCNCGLCIKRCPGQCIVPADGDREGSKILTEHCASFISQKKQELTLNQLEILKKADTVFGCDSCQMVCPHNKDVILSDTLEENRAFFSGTLDGSKGGKNLFTEDILNTVTTENLEKIYKDRAFGFRGLKVLQRNLQIYNNDTIE